MALICPACGTENRAVARFCIECIGVLEPEFPPTQVVSPRKLVSDGTTLLGMPTALAEFAAAKPLPPIVGARDSRPVRIAPEPRKGLWLSVAAFAITLVIGAAGWLIAGAGGLYIYSTNSAPTASEPAAESHPAAAVPVLAAAVPVAPAMAALTAPAAPPKPIEPAVQQAMAPQAAPRPAATAPLSPPVATAAVAKPRPVPAVPPAAARSGAAVGPSTQCTGLNFFSESRCMVTQCARPEYRQHGECAAVLAQQKLVEEKRNPTN